MHVRGRAGVTEAHEAVAVDRIEIDAGCRRHMGLFQHLLGECEAVGRKARYIRIEVEGAVHRQNPVEPGLRQNVEQNQAVRLVDVLHGLGLIAAIEGRLRGDLRKRRHRYGEIALQPVDRAHQLRRQHHPAHPPAGHAEIFGERVDDHDVVRQPRGGLGRKGIVEAVIDLIGDEADALALCGRQQISERRRRHHGAGRVGGARYQHALERRPAMGRDQQVRGDRPAR